MSSQHRRKLLMIPGPTEFDSSVLEVLGEPSLSHVAPSFIKEFGQVLRSLRKILFADSDCQPFVLSGGGSLGWDCIVSSLCDAEAGDRALVLNTGYFSDSFATCCERYGIECDQVRADAVGSIVTPEALEEFLQREDVLKRVKSYKMVCVTHVDTSTGVVNCVPQLIDVIKKVCGDNVFVAVDGVCSFAGEEFYFSKWKVDACMTASQKALGCPPGLCVMMLSGRATKIVEERKGRVKSYYCDLNNWIPIMRKYEAEQPSYFSTPNTNLVRALNVSCEKLLNKGMEKVFDQHVKMSNAFKDAVAALGLEFVPKERKYMAHTLTAIRYPKGVNGKELLTFVKECDVVFAGGLHKEIKTEYFRVGHMGISTNNGCDHLLRSIRALEYALAKAGYKFEPGTGEKIMRQLVKFDEAVDESNGKGVGKQNIGASEERVNSIITTSLYVAAGIGLGYWVSNKLQEK